MTYQTALVLEALAAGRNHGWDVMDATDLPSGTVYDPPRLDERGWSARAGRRSGRQTRTRPTRRYYELTPAG